MWLSKLRIFRRLKALEIEQKQINERLGRFRMTILEEIAAIKANSQTVSDTLDSISAGVAALDQKITDLKNQIAAGAIPADVRAAVDDLSVTSTALVDKAKAINTAPPA